MAELYWNQSKDLLKALDIPTSNAPIVEEPYLHREAMNLNIISLLDLDRDERTIA